MINGIAMTVTAAAAIPGLDEPAVGAGTGAATSRRRRHSPHHRTWMINAATSQMAT
jgi:hypothetical protein